MEDKHFLAPEYANWVNTKVIPLLPEEIDFNKLPEEVAARVTYTWMSLRDKTDPQVIVDYILQMTGWHPE